MSVLNGWKTIFGGLVLLCGAIYTGFELHDIKQALVLFGGGMTALGLGGKAEKIIAAIENAGVGGDKSGT